MYKIYIGYDNPISIQLLENASGKSFTGVTQIAIIIGSTTYTGDNTADSRILWDQAGYETGQVNIALGVAGAAGDTDVPTAGKYYDCPLVLTSSDYSNGYAWAETINIEVIQL